MKSELVTTNYEEALVLDKYLLGVNLPPVTTTPKVIENGRTTLVEYLDNDETSETLSIDPDLFGVFAPMIKSANVKITYVTSELENGVRITILDLDYRYQHPSGSNGYNVRLYSRNGGELKETWN
jgi:hypothetical protein